MWWWWCNVKIQVKVSLELKDRNGNIKERREFYSRSWVKNFIVSWVADIAGWGMTVRDRDGNERSYRGYAGVDGYTQTPPMGGITAYLRQKVRNANVGSSDKCGILIGTGGTAWNRNQYCLDEQITGDVVTHGNMEIEDGTEDPVEPYVRLKRTFTNNSGIDITVREIGLFFNYYLYGGIGEVETNYNYMVIRDVLETPITIPNGESLTVKYLIFVSY